MTDKENDERLTVSQAINLISSVLTDDNDSSVSHVRSNNSKGWEQPHSFDAANSSYAINSYPRDDFKHPDLSDISQNFGGIYKDENYKSGCSTQSYSQSYSSTSKQENCSNFATQNSSQYNAYIIEAHDDYMKKAGISSTQEDAYISEAYDDFMKKKF